MEPLWKNNKMNNYFIFLIYFYINQIAKLALWNTIVNFIPFLFVFNYYFQPTTPNLITSFLFCFSLSFFFIFYTLVKPDESKNQGKENTKFSENENFIFLCFKIWFWRIIYLISFPFKISTFFWYSNCVQFIMQHNKMLVVKDATWITILNFMPIAFFSSYFWSFNLKILIYMVSIFFSCCLFHNFTNSNCQNRYHCEGENVFFLFVKIWIFRVTNLFFSIFKIVSCVCVSEDLMSNFPNHLSGSNFAKIQFFMTLKLRVLFENEDGKLPLPYVVDYMKSNLSEYFPKTDEDTGPMFEYMVSLIVKQRPETFSFENEISHTGEETFCLVYKKNINVQVRCNTTDGSAEKLLHFYFHPSQKVSILIEELESRYPNILYTNLYTSSLKKCLLTSKDQSFDDLDIKNGSEIDMITSSSLKLGGDPILCSTCEQPVKAEIDLCEHFNCKNCRRLDTADDCQCCKHTRKGEVCPHGNCTKCLSICRSHISKNPTFEKICACIKIEEFVPRRSSRNRQMIDPPPNNSQKNTSVYPSFPITTYQNQEINRENFYYLQDHEWYKMQALLFFSFCSDLPVDQKRFDPTFTKTIFFRNKFVPGFDENCLQKLHENFCSKKIQVENYLNEIRQQQNTISGLVNNISLLYDEYDGDDLIPFLHEIVLNLFTKNPGLKNDFPIPPVLFKFAFGILESLIEIFKIIDKDIHCSSKMKAIDRNKALCWMLYENRYDLENSVLKKNIATSNHFIEIAREHIANFKANKVNNWERVFQKYSKYTHATITLIKKFWEKFSEPNACKKTAKGKINGETAIVPVRYMNQNMNEYYENFCSHPNFGKKCQTNSGKHEIPSLTTFRLYRPFYVRPYPGIRTCFCSNCMQMDAYLQTFLRIMKDHCKCDKNCTSENCDSCKVCDLSLSKTSFVNFLTCCSPHNERGGRKYPDKWECVSNKCSTCKLDDISDLVNFFCPNSFEKLDLEKEYLTKGWEHKAEEVCKKGDKSSWYKFWSLEPIYLTTSEFLETFLQFLTEKRGFKWHHYCSYFQRFQYNSMIEKIKNGDYGTNLEVDFFVIDWAGDYTYKGGRRIAGDQFFGVHKCQILGIVQFFNFNKIFHGIANFVFSDQKAHKSLGNTFDEIKKLIEKSKKKNPVLKTIHIFSDGSTTDFLTKNCSSGMKKFSKSMNINVVWHYFANKHGKNICDSCFSRIKCKLDEIVINLNKKFKNAFDIFEKCKEYANPEKWKANGDQITERQFFFRPAENNEPRIDLCWPRAPTDTKLHRCVIFDSNGNFYRRHCSCSCIKCITDPTSFGKCLEKHPLTGDFNIYPPPKKKRKKKAISKWRSTKKLKEEPKLPKSFSENQNSIEKKSSAEEKFNFLFLEEEIMTSADEDFSEILESDSEPAPEHKCSLDSDEEVW